VNPIEEYEANQRSYEEERYAKLLRDMREPVNFCHTPEPDEGTDAPLIPMLLWAAAGLAAWALFGWGIISWIGGAP